jgi:hypothetical protein
MAMGMRHVIKALEPTAQRGGFNLDGIDRLFKLLHEKFGFSSEEECGLVQHVKLVVADIMANHELRQRVFTFLKLFEGLCRAPPPVGDAEVGSSRRPSPLFAMRLFDALRLGPLPNPFLNKPISF